MILVDSSVWIDYLRGTQTPQAEKLDSLLGEVPLAVGDLILVEVLQGCSTERESRRVERLLSRLHFVVLGGREIALEAARNVRKLRALGITPRKTIDVIIATRCLLDGLELLHCDRDFRAFETHLNLRSVECRPR